MLMPGLYSKRVVVTLTTLPDRLEKGAVIPCLKSLWNQTRVPDAVYLGLPPVAKRFNKPYPEPSDELLTLCTVVPIEEDFGPVTKILGGLYVESDPDTVVITVDDDNIYHPVFIEKMLKAHLERPEAAIGSAGVIVGQFPGYFAYIRNGIGGKYEAWWHGDVPENGQQMDILCGYAGILYSRKMFPAKSALREDFLALPLNNSSVFMHDDVFISSYVNSRGFERWVYNMPEVANPHHHADSLSGDMWDFYPKLIKAYKACSDAGMIKSKVCIPYKHTITGRVVIALLLVILLVFVIIFLIKNREMIRSKFLPSK